MAFLFTKIIGKQVLGVDEKHSRDTLKWIYVKQLKQA